MQGGTVSFLSKSKKIKSIKSYICNFITKFFFKHVIFTYKKN